MESKKVAKQVTIRFESKRLQRFEKHCGIEPLRDVVQRAVDTIHCSGIDARWIAEVGLRATAKAIIERGHIPMPLRVKLEFDEAEIAANRPIRVPQCQQGKSETSVGFSDVELVSKKVRVPKKFVQLCKEYYHVDPLALAAGIIYEFTLNPPRNLILVEQGEAK